MRWRGSGGISLVLLGLSFPFASCGVGGSLASRHAGGESGADNAAPTVLSVTPATGATIGNAISNGTIAIVFSETMDPDSHTIGGDLAASSDGGTWETTTVANDTLVLAPAGTTTSGNTCQTYTPCWSANGAAVDNTLVIDADDNAGNPVAQVNLAYRIDNDDDGAEDLNDSCPGDATCQ